jgi:cytochrome c oxidase assembly protein subunit 15
MLVLGAAWLVGHIAWIWPLAAVLAVQILWGAFTAGLRAGHSSDTWPLMLGSLVPAGILNSARDLIADPVTVQFVHRSLAYLVAAGTVLAAWRLWRAGAGRRALALGGIVAVQFALGVAVIVNHVPIPLGVAHQAGAALFVAALTWAAHWAVRTRAGPPATFLVGRWRCARPIRSRVGSAMAAATPTRRITACTRSAPC